MKQSHQDYWINNYNPLEEDLIYDEDEYIEEEL